MSKKKHKILQPLSEDSHTISIVAISQVAERRHINRRTHTNPTC